MSIYTTSRAYHLHSTAASKKEGPQFFSDISSQRFEVANCSIQRSPFGSDAIKPILCGRKGLGKQAALFSFKHDQQFIPAEAKHLLVPLPFVSVKVPPSSCQDLRTDTRPAPCLPSLWTASTQRSSRETHSNRQWDFEIVSLALDCTGFSTAFSNSRYVLLRN